MSRAPSSRGEPGRPARRRAGGVAQRWSIRRQAAAIVAVVMAIALGVAGAVVVGALSSYLHGAAERTVDTRLTRLVTAVQRAATRPQPAAALPQLVGPPLLRANGDITAVQVIGPDGSVLAGSDVAPAQPMTQDTPAHSAVRSRAVPTPAGRFTVAVAYDTRRIDDTMRRATAYLLFTWPVAVLVAALVAHQVVGRSLATVERMRVEAARIGGGAVHARLPVPPTGDELTRLATTLNGMLERLELSQLTQRQFVADASHEIRSPLATITTALELGQRDPLLLDPDLIGSTLLPAGHRLQAIVDDLLLLARADERGLETKTDDVDLDDVVQQVCTGAVVPPGLRLATEVQPVRVRGDAGQLGRAVRNLVDNALRHASSTVQVRLGPLPQGAVVTVDDDGAGIPAEHRDRVFERFARLDDSRSRDSGGTGLGLAIVAEVARAHGGGVRVDASALGGARFVLTVPTPGPPAAAAQAEKR